MSKYEFKKIESMNEYEYRKFINKDNRYKITDSGKMYLNLFNYEDNNLNKDEVCKNLHDKELKYCSEVELVLDFEELVRKNIIGFILMILVLIGVMVYLIKYYKQQMKDFKKRLAEKKNAVRRMNLQLIASVNKPLLTEIVTPTKRIVSSTLGKADIVNVLHMDPTNV